MLYGFFLNFSVGTHIYKRLHTHVTMNYIFDNATVPLRLGEYMVEGFITRIKNIKFDHFTIHGSNDHLLLFSSIIPIIPFHDPTMRCSCWQANAQKQKGQELRSVSAQKAIDILKVYIHYFCEIYRWLNFKK